jgi:hypothetical protein
MNVASILRYTPAGDNWEVIPNSAYTTGLNTGLVTGAVDLATGKYLFGGFGTTSKYVSAGNYYQGALTDTIVFKLYSFNPADNTITTVGSFDTGRAAWVLNNNLYRYDPVAMNGDMSFDSADNLYIVGSGATTQIFTITKATLAGANGGTLAFSKTDEKTLGSLTNVNGMAFDQDGTVYLGNGSTVKRYKAQDWTLAANGNVTTGLSNSTDLGSCQSPANIAVKKNVVARANSTDQFRLSLAQGSTSIATADTAGTDDGVQTQQIGPVPALLNQTYTVGESMISGSASDYTSGYACVRKDTGATVASGSGTSGSVTIPNVASVSVECTFTNTPIPKTGALTIAKAFDSSVPSGATGPFSGRYTCSGTGLAAATGSWTVNGTGAAALTADSGSASPSALPAGLSCSVTETVPASGASTGLPASYVWGTPTVSGPVTIAANATSNVTVTNKATQQKGALAITKAFDSSVPSGATGPFSGKYTCTGTGLVTATGSWTVNGTGAATLTADQGSASPTALPVGLSCSATETSPAAGSSTGLPNSYAWGTPAISSAVTIAVDATKTVTVTNKATHVTGSVSWNKTDESGHALAGSQWTITPTNPSGAAITVVDNGTNDADPTAGALKVTGLNEGKYELQESKAPAGYVLSDTKYSFEITATGLTATVNGGSPIKNTQVVPPVLPFTGGMSTDEFLIGGTGLIVLSLGLAFVWRRKRASSM